MTRAEQWQAVAKSDASFDGVFFYAVKSTGIFCRPSCKSKVPLPGNVVFYKTIAEARLAGFRPCKRCRPDLLEYRPQEDIARKAKALVDASFAQRQALLHELKALGVSRHRMDEIFKEYYGATVCEYWNALRLSTARNLLARTDETVLAVAFASGFESVSAFYRFFGKCEGMPPAAYRQEHARKDS